MEHNKASWDFYARGPGKRRENRKLAGLQRHTASVTACAWPNCDRTTPDTFAGERLGVLCLDHAWSHYDAMNQFLVWDGTTDDSVAKALIAALRKRQVPLDVLTEEEVADLEDALQEGWVYYLQVGEQIKIGFSTNVRQRLRSYPPGSKLLAIESGKRSLEKRRHGQFAEWLVAGREWFEPSPELIQHTQDLVRMYGNPRHMAHSYREPAWRQERRQPMRIKARKR